MPLSGLTVLAIDNEPSILEGMRALLGGWGCQVITAASLAEALDRLREDLTVPEVIVADYHLDEGDGLQAVAALRATSGTDIPAVLLTADRSLALRNEAEGLQIHVLNKPLKPAALRALLAQWRATRIAAE
jgi:CheY-like chemotaxis protein